MKLSVLGIAASVLAFPQANTPTTQQATNCAQNFAGNNNTGTITCYGVDKKLADQMAQLVSASKRDDKTIKDISEKIDVFLQAQPSTTITQQAPGGINSVVTGGTPTVNNTVVNQRPVPRHILQDG